MILYVTKRRDTIYRPDDDRPMLRAFYEYPILTNLFTGKYDTGFEWWKTRHFNEEELTSINEPDSKDLFDFLYSIPEINQMGYEDYPFKVEFEQNENGFNLISVSNQWKMTDEYESSCETKAKEKIKRNYLLKNSGLM